MVLQQPLALGASTDGPEKEKEAREHCNRHIATASGQGIFWDKSLKNHSNKQPWKERTHTRELRFEVSRSGLPSGCVYLEATSIYSPVVFDQPIFHYVTKSECFLSVWLGDLSAASEPIAKHLSLPNLIDQIFVGQPIEWKSSVCPGGILASTRQRKSNQWLLWVRSNSSSLKGSAKHWCLQFERTCPAERNLRQKPDGSLILWGISRTCSAHSPSLGMNSTTWLTASNHRMSEDAPKLIELHSNAAGACRQPQVGELCNFLWVCFMWSIYHVIL